MFDNLVEEVNSLYEKALTAYENGHYEQGIQLAQQACELGKLAFSTDNHNYATLLNMLGQLYLKMRRLTDAEPLVRQAMEIRKVQLGQNHPSYATSLNNLAGLYYEMGRLTEAEPLFRQAMEIRKVQLGQNHPSYAASLNNLAGLYYEMGRLREVEPLFRQAMEIRRVQLGENHPDYADSLNNLASLCQKMGRFTEAEPFYREAMEIRKVQLGQNHPSYATSLNNLAGLYYEMGRFTEAEPLYWQAMEIQKVQLGQNHPSYAASLDNLALLYREMGRLTEAEPLYWQAMEIWKAQLGENHPDYATSLSGLATLYDSMGRFTESETLHRQAMEIQKVQLGENHPDYATSLNNLAEMYRKMGRLTEAEPLHRQAMEIRQVQLGENHPDYAQSLNNLALLYYERGRFTEAEPLYRQAMEIRQVQLGENHPLYAQSLNNLALLCQEMGQLTEAEPLYRQAMEIRQVQLGENHPDYADSLNNLASLCQKMGRFTEAEPFYWEAMEIRQVQLGENHPSYAHSLNNLASLYRKMGRLTDAEPLVQQAMEIRQVQLGQNHPLYAQSLNNLAGLYYEMGRFTEAEPFYREAMEIRRVQLGENHPDYATSLNNLAALYHAMGRFTESESLYRQAIEIEKEQLGENHPDYATSLNNLAELYRKMGRLTDAEPLHREAMEIRQVQLGENHLNYAQSLNNLALLYHAMGQFTESEPLLRQAMEIRRVQLGENHPDYAGSLNNLAGLYLAMGRFTESEPLFRQAIEIEKLQLGENHPDYAHSLYSSAELYRAMGRFTDAKTFNRQAMEIRKVQLGENHPDYAASLYHLAALMAATDRPQEAFQLMQQATQIQNRTIGEILSISSDRQRLEYMQQNYWQLEIFLSLITQYLPEEATAKQAALDLVLRRKGLATEAGLLLRSLIFSGRYPHLMPEFEKLRQLIQQVSFLTTQMQNQSGERLSGYRAELARVTQEREEVERSLSRQMPEMNLQMHLNHASREAIAQALPKGSTLVEFVRFYVFNFKAVKAHGDKQWFPARYLAFVLPAGEAAGVEMIDLGEADEIDRLCQTFRLSVSDKEQSHPDRDMAFNLPKDKTPVGKAPDPVSPMLYTTSEGQELYQTLIVPLKRYLQDYQTVYIAPDGELTTLPFGILSQEGTAYLMDEYGLRYLSVGRDLLRFQFPIPVNYTDSLVIANPDYNLRVEGLKLPNLPQAIAQEMTPPPPQIKGLKPPKQPQPIAQEMMLAVAGAIAFLSYFILLAVFPMAILLLVFGILWLAVVVHNASYGDRLHQFEKQAREYDRQVTQPITPEGVTTNVRSDSFRSQPIPIQPTQPASPVSEEVRSLLRELGEGPGEVFTKLPGTQIEGKLIAELLGVPLYTEAQAVKSLLSRCRSPKIVHIATHGYFLPIDQTPPDWGMLPQILGSETTPGMPLSVRSRYRVEFQDPMTRSGLALAGANTARQGGILPEPAEEGVLTAQGAFQVDLTGTRLVVLSACNTALGDQTIGEGVLGLRRSFIVAGAETVVMSLWSVPDVPTAILMERFYHNLFQTDWGRTEALEEAQRYLQQITIAKIRAEWLTEEAINEVAQHSEESAIWLKILSTKPDDFRPFAGVKYWAAFVCIGNPSLFPK
ncbi:CHAT domain-containing protein [Laspinema olomoucense]|uniref:Tetratricopeptide repeat protein n=1 Tax=Laspinema olomoucense D3b TaxID=2953688 RepID=A0ABT2N2B6_9CYAN|nr:CHAT domain-containing protein [Laspinema sp. D3b]MCT7976825.1 tetratricopeptide repeat protein [Laspinema sp. D3b]